MAGYMYIGARRALTPNNRTSHRVASAYTTHSKSSPRGLLLEHSDLHTTARCCCLQQTATTSDTTHQAERLQQNAAAEVRLHPTAGASVARHCSMLHVR